jgi:hypothetical protein
MNEHLEGLIHEHRYEGYATRMEAAQRYCQDHGVEWPAQDEAQRDLVSRLHYAYQGQCSSCGCWWQDVTMAGLYREPYGCPSKHGYGRWVCLAFTFSPPAFESGIPGRNVPPARMEPNVQDPMERERLELRRRRAEVAAKFPNLMCPDEVKAEVDKEMSSQAEQKLLRVLESMKDVPLKSMPYRLRQVVKKLRGADEESDEAKALEFGRTVEDEGGDEGA